jgi:hypothetical protein
LSDCRISPAVRASKSSFWKGLPRLALTPGLITYSLCLSAVREVIMMTGRFCVLASRRICRVNSKPSIRGINIEQHHRRHHSDQFHAVFSCRHPITCTRQQTPGNLAYSQRVIHDHDQRLSAQHFDLAHLAPARPVRRTSCSGFRINTTSSLPSTVASAIPGSRANCRPTFLTTAPLLPSSSSTYSAMR